MAKIGDLKVSSAGDYAGGKFYVEQFGYTNASDPHWHVPAWEERGYGNLAGSFATATEAQTAINEELA